MTVTESAPLPQPAKSLPWAPVVWFLLLLIAGYYPVLYQLVGDWISNEDMGHGFFVPAVAAYIAWTRRDDLLKIDLRPHWLGLAVFLCGFLQLAAATLGVELFLSRTAFIVSLAGMILYLGGWVLLRELLFVLFLLVFMVPLPAIIYSQITFPLQLLASQIAESSLGLINIPVLREGNILELPSQRLSVVEACSGIRSLLSLTFLALVYGHFFDHRPWMKWCLLVITVPIAIIANAGRVTLTGILSEKSPELAQGFFHSLEGWVIFMVAMVLLIATHRLLILAMHFAKSRFS